MAYLAKLNGRAENLRHTSKPLISVQRWLSEGSRVNDVAKVLVQGFREKVQVPLQESPIEFGDEFDFRGVVAF
jgi:hypothetical protein